MMRGVVVGVGIAPLAPLARRGRVGRSVRPRPRLCARGGACRVRAGHEWAFEGEEAPKGIDECVERFTTDMTALADRGVYRPIQGRDVEMDDLTGVLLKRSKRNALLLGEAGVGKTAIVEEFARRVWCRDDSLKGEFDDTTVLMLDVCALIAGSSSRGALEERMGALLKELTRSDGGVVLFIDEIHTIVDASGPSQAKQTKGMQTESVIDMLKPPMARGQIQVIGATTRAEYVRFFRDDATFNRRFRCVDVPEPDVDRTLEIMRDTRVGYEDFHKCRITDDALEKSVLWAERYVTYRSFPDKSLDLIDEACSRVVLEAHADPARVRTVDVDDVAGVVSFVTGMDETSLVRPDARKVRDLDRALRARVVGQPYAVDRVTAAMTRRICGISDPDRPLCSMLFVGPPGVGKSEAAKVMSECFFGGGVAPIRLDMSEYMERSAVASLIGSPPGYVGYGDGGALTNAIRRRPCCVVVLDEVEKAHPEVLNLLLQILGDGRIADNLGRPCYFRNAVVVMTSNASAEVFPPELRNRIDEVVRFDPIERAALYVIVNREVGLAMRRVDASTVVVTSRTRRRIHELACAHPDKGAREVRRLVDRHVCDAVSEARLRRTASNGRDKTIVV